MTIDVLGRLSSANVQKAIWALEELGLAYEQKQVGGPYGGNDSPEYLAMNPNGLVPTLRDGDLVVWESNAILRYLASAYGAGSLSPADPKQRAIVDQWTDWTATTFQPAWLAVFSLVVRTPIDKQDPAVIAKAVAAAERGFAMLDARLGQVPFLGGEQFSYADIAAGCRCIAGPQWRSSGQALPMSRPGTSGLANARRFARRSMSTTKSCAYGRGRPESKHPHARSERVFGA